MADLEVSGAMNGQSSTTPMYLGSLLSAARLSCPSCGEACYLHLTGWVKRIRELREVENTAKEQRQAFEHRVQDFMGGATELISPLDTPAARWRPVERTSIDTKALRAAHPDIAGEFSRTTTTRRFEANP
jgi:predicted phage-related endonuclease